MIFNSKLLSIIRESRGINQSDFANSLGIKQGTLSKYENGNIIPSREVIITISELLIVNTKIFDLSVTSFTSGISFHRKSQDLSQKEQNEYNSKFNFLSTLINKLLTNVDLSHIDVPIIDISGDKSPFDIARELRNYWQIPHGPISNISKVLESKGIFISLFESDNENIDGISFTNLNPPIFFIKKKPNGDRFRFTIAHELGHLIMHREPNDDIELQAHEFASEFLMPADDIRDDLKDLSYDKLPLLKMKWKTSMIAIIYRAHSMELITDNQLKYLKNKLYSDGYRMIEPVEIALDMPTALTQIIEHYKKYLNYTDKNLADYLGIKEKEFHQIFIKPSISEIKKIKLTF